MKQKLTILFMLFLVLGYSQTPELINYQAVLRDSQGQILSNQQLDLQFSIIRDNTSGLTIYQEIHEITTSDFGQVTIQIGGGTATMGDFSLIDWGSDEYFVQTAIDSEGSGTFMVLGVSQLVSVPYALNSKRTESLILTDQYGNEHELWVDTLGNIGTYPSYEIGEPCPGLPYIDYDGQTYYTIEIGNQCWLRENLNIGTMINGTMDMQDNDTIEKYCYGNIEENCETYGGLYQWDELMQYDSLDGAQGICPNGWHIPSDLDWCNLEQEVDTTIICNSSSFRGVDGGDKLKEVGTTHWNNNTLATNSSGFTALPGGWRSPTGGAFNQINNRGYFWTSSQEGTESWYHALTNSESRIFRNSNPAENGFSLRCIRNQSVNQPPNTPQNPDPTEGSTEISISQILNWSCSDPDNDLLNFDVYFGTENPPIMINQGQTELSFNPGVLSYNQTYYWKIAAYDEFGTTEGQIWSFTTEEPPTNDLVAFYPFNLDSNDESINEYHLTENGAVLTDDRFGNSNSAYYFDGNNNNLIDDVGYPGFELSESICFALWIKPDNVTPSINMGIAGKGNSTRRNYNLYLNPDSKAVFIVEGVVNTETTSTTILETDSWYFLVGVYDFDHSIKLYVNGILEDEAPFTGIPETSTSSFSIGCQGNDSCEDWTVSFEGKIDDVRLYDNVLSGDEIQALYLLNGWDN